jgi:WD40 repeat protein
MPPRDPEGWWDLSHFHVLLAQEQDKRRATLESLEEWQLALEAHEQANLLMGSDEPAPGLYAGLGKAHAESGRQESAQRFLLKARQQYLAIGRPDLAGNLLDSPGKNLELTTVANFGFVLETRLPWQGGAIRTLAFMPDGTRLVAGGSVGGFVFSLADSKVQPAGALVGPREEVLAVAVSPDGKTIAMVDGSGSLYIYDAASLDLLARVPEAHSGAATAVAFTTDGIYVLTGGEDGRIKAWTLRGSLFAEVSKGFPHEDPVVFLAGVPPGRNALSVGQDRRIVLWQVDTQQAIRPTLIDMDVRSAALGGGGRLLALGLQELRGNLHHGVPDSPVAAAHEIQADDRVRLMDTGSGVQVREFEGEEQDLEAVGVTPDGRFIASAGSGSDFLPSIRMNSNGLVSISAGSGPSASVWDAATGKLITSIPFDEPVTALNFSPDGHWMAAGTEKGALFLYRLSGVGPALEQPEPGGQILIRLLEPVAARGSTAPVRIDSGTVRIHGKIKADTPLRSLEVDGEEITSIVLDGEGNYLFTANVQLPVPGRRQIEILAEDQKGTKARELITVERPETVRQPELGPGRRIALVIGISDYADSALDLDYADDDAQALYDLLTSPALGPAAFLKENVRLLLDRDATAANINVGLREFLQTARENDFVLFYFAGHGVPDPNRLNDLYLMAHDSLPGNVAGTGILMRYVREALADIPARDVLILSDACHSGGIGAVMGSRTLPVNPINQVFLEKMIHSSGGLAILTASEAAQSSLDISKQRHGVFTYYLLQGLTGEADSDHDRLVTLGEIIEFVRDNVKKETNGRQIPTVGPTSFDRSLPLVIVPQP